MSGFPARKRRKRRAAASFAAVLAVAWIAPSAVYAGAQQDTPQSAPRDPRAPAEERRSDETLSDRLDRNNGVLHPPAGVDPKITVPAPDPNPHSTPVIPPPGTPGGNPSVVPK